MNAHTDQEVLKTLLGPTQPLQTDKYNLPTNTVNELPLLDILHHERHLGRHIQRAANRRGDAIRQATLLTRAPGHPSSRSNPFNDIIANVQHISRTLDEDRRLHLLLTNRRKALLRNLRHQPPTILTISSSTLPALSHTNYYAPLLDEVDLLPPAGGDSHARIAPSTDPTTDGKDNSASTPTHSWTPRRTRHSRAATAASPQPTPTPMDITLEHAADLNRRVLPIPSLQRLPDPGPFSLTGGYKTTQASTISQQLVVTYLNVGGLTAHKLDFILAYMQKTNTNILICSDARLTDKAGRRLEKRTKSILGPFSRVHYTALSKDARTRRTPSCPLVGGFFCIVNDRWGPSLLTCKSDRTGLGVLTCLPLRTADGTISILGTYWPIPYTEASVEDHPGSFWAQIQSWCHRNDIDKSPIDYVRDLSLAWLNTELKNGSIAAIYGGDLNAIWSAGEQGGSYVLGPWAEEHGFINGPVQIAQHRKERFHTHQSGSWLDHILHMGALGHIDILGAHVSTGVEWKGISDHRPITAQYRVARPSTKPPYWPRPLQNVLNLTAPTPGPLRILTNS